MKRYIFFIICLIIISAAVSVGVSTSVISLQDEYIQLRQKEKQLIAENNHLARETAHLASLQRISEKAEELGLAKIDNQLIYIDKDIYAALR